MIRTILPIIVSFLLNQPIGVKWVSIVFETNQSMIQSDSEVIVLFIKFSAPDSRDFPAVFRCVSDVIKIYTSRLSSQI